MPRERKSPSFDLRKYISRYDPTSETRIERLLFLARSGKCDPKLAYRLLEDQLKQAGNVIRYAQVFGQGSAAAAGDAMDVDSSVAQEGKGRSLSLIDFLCPPNQEFSYIPPNCIGIDIIIVKILTHNLITKLPLTKEEFLPSKHGFQFDEEFAQSASLEAHEKLEALEANLRSSRSALAKDAIVTASTQLARHLIATGQSSDAMQHLIMAASSCSSQWQLQELFLLRAEVGLNTRNYQRVKDLYDPSVDNKNFTSSSFLAKLNAARGVAYLAEGQINEAAKSFMAVTNDMGNNFNQVLSEDDLAMYSGITALLALDRSEIEAMATVEKNGPSNLKSSAVAAFGERLEAIPALKKAIQAYVSADYGECLNLVNGLRGSWNDDIYLAPQAENLWKKVRGKCLVQYFEPYSSVSLHSVMESFAFQSLDEVEDVVADLIKKKGIEGARIDGVKKTLNGLSVDQLERKRRRVLMRRLGRMGDGLLDEVEGMLLRMSCVQKGIIVGQSRGRSGKSRTRRRDWGDAMSKDAYDIYGNDSSDEDGIGEMITEAEEDELMDTGDL